MGQIRSAGFFNIDHDLSRGSSTDAPISTHGTTSDHAKNAATQTKQNAVDQIEAQLWQLNQFLQAERKHQPDTEGVLHAIHTKRGIQLYVRPKKSGFFSALFDSITNGQKQKLAAETLAVIANKYKANCVASKSSNPEFKAPTLDFLKKSAASMEVDAIASGMEEIAIAISNKYLKKESGPGQPIQKNIRRILDNRSDLNFRSHINFSEAAFNKLVAYGFSFAEVNSFLNLVNNIVDGRESGDKDLYAINKFKTQWLHFCDDKSSTGKVFRRFIVENPEFHIWNLVAHHLENRTVPTYDLRSYAGYDCVMVPQTSEMIWSEFINDNGLTYTTVEKLHEDAAKEGMLHPERISHRRQWLFAGKSIVINPNANKLETAQRSHLARAYETIIKNQTIYNNSSVFLLTPLFNYTESTVDECISIMLNPLKSALKEGNASLQLKIFSTDPRIVEKFNTAMRTLQKNAKNKPIAVEHYFTATSIPKDSASVAIIDQSAALPESILGGISKVTEEMGEAARETADKAQEVAKDVYKKTEEAAKNFSSKAEKVTKIVSNEVSDFTQRLSNKVGEEKEVFDNTVADAVAHLSSDDIKAPAEVFNKNNGDDINGLMTKELEVDETSGESICPASSSTANTPERQANEFPAAVSYVDVIGGQKTPGKKRRIKPQNIMEAKIAPPVTRAPIVAKEVQIQIGITENNLKPSKSAIMMLTRSSAEFVQSDQIQLKTNLETFLKSDEFAKCEQAGDPFTYNGSLFVVRPELSIGSPADLFTSYKENDASSKIAQTYKTICEYAETYENKELVLTPYFSLPNRIRFGNAYEEAITMMLETVEESRVKFPELAITVIARSENERMLMQNTLKNLKEQKQSVH